MGRAIVREPSAFLMDEPLSNLDAKLRVQMRAEITRIQRRVGVATVYVTHDQTEAMTMGDRVAVLNAGTVQQCDKPQYVVRHARQHVRVGSSGEYGLLFAFFTNKPGAKELDGEPTLSLEDIESMFVHKRLPEGWESWRKTRADWITNTTALMVSAGKAYLAIQR